MAINKFDRELQLALLSKAVDCYPESTHKVEFPDIVLEADDDKLIANIMYLNEHGLIVDGYLDVMAGVVPNMDTLKATKDGIDFILDDGGLSAILNVVTIKFHDDAVKQISDFIQKSSATNEDKSRLLSGLKSLPSDAIKHIALKLLEQGLTRTPDVIHWLGTMIP